VPQGVQTRLAFGRKPVLHAWRLKIGTEPHFQRERSSRLPTKWFCRTVSKLGCQPVQLAFGHSSSQIIEGLLMWNMVRRTSAFVATKHRVLGTITHVRTDEKVVALTFDDGPDPEYTPQLLQLLRDNQARATFFVVGKRAEQHPDLLEQIVRDGHLLGNHSWSHTALPLLSRTQRLRDIYRCHRLLGRQPRRLLRPPYGYQDRQSRLDLYLLGYEAVAWNAAGDDCLGAGAEAIRDRLLQEIKPGSIVLLHDTLYRTSDARYRDRRPTFDALSEVFAQLAGRYRFLTVAELMELGEPQKVMWWSKPNVEMLDTLF
jgi:peptidoglycan-N-acetylglucosamine deacetylase